MLSPASGCNLTFGTVKIEDTVDRIESFHLNIYRSFIIFPCKRTLRCSFTHPARKTSWYVLVSEMSSGNSHRHSDTDLYTHTSALSAFPSERQGG